jgi:hypothetical protein
MTCERKKVGKQINYNLKMDSQLISMYQISSNQNQISSDQNQINSDQFRSVVQISSDQFRSVQINSEQYGIRSDFKKPSIKNINLDALSCDHCLSNEILLIKL